MDDILRLEFETWYVKHCDEHGGFKVTMEEVKSKRGTGNYEEYGYLSGAWYGFRAARA